MDSWLRRAWETYRIGRRTFGKGNLDLILGQGLLHGIRRFSMRMEGVPSLQQPPIVIAGLPRTGTTFLQRFLHEQSIAKGQNLFAQFLPTSSLQSLFRPVLPLIERISPARHHRPDIHTTGMLSIETDEACLFFQQLDGFFLYAFIWALDEQEHLSFFDVEHRDVTKRDFAWLERCWAYSTQDSGLCPVAKLFGLGACIPSFLEFFPEAKILYTARDPVSVIPSTLSLLLSVLAQRYDWNALSQEHKHRYIMRITDALIELMYRFHRDWSTGAIDKTKCMIIPYHRLEADFEHTMRDILAFVDYTPSMTQLQVIHEQNIRQQSRKSAHRYLLQEYGLDEEMIREKTAFFTPYWSMESAI